MVLFQGLCTSCSLVATLSRYLQDLLQSLTKCHLKASYLPKNYARTPNSCLQNKIFFSNFKGKIKSKITNNFSVPTQVLIFECFSSAFIHLHMYFYIVLITIVIFCFNIQGKVLIHT